MNKNKLELNDILEMTPNGFTKEEKQKIKNDKQTKEEYINMQFANGNFKLPKKIIRESEDGMEEISMQEAIEYCGELQIKEAMINRKNCTLKDTLEFDSVIRIKF